MFHETRQTVVRGVTVYCCRVFTVTTLSLSRAPYGKFFININLKFSLEVYTFIEVNIPFDTTKEMGKL